ncbi:GNAT family N-acetyltransferase [Roseobacter sinensis]|uniref:GNAT family N-acetyltransferase n=1 Tax=Roseobacter sinensis TaxID=2931391 RepID=A0ABT3BDL5_9RHOB|nr:GNAT family N-acetyltransferase [Roseobacter sp. WL0113]MCV3271637.1 GNAT family N-acetyltransferase [Roseobacter sp. WL0113]
MIRWAAPQDAEALGQVFYSAVRDGPSPYTEAQRAAWVRDVPSGPRWAARLTPLRIAVAEVDGTVAGFMSIESGGYIDLAFIRPAHRGAGLFRQLAARVEDHARSKGEPLLWTHASLMAQPAFRAVGFSTIHHERVERHGEHLDRARMEKRLG